jgi:flagellin
MGYRINTNIHQMMNQSNLVNTKNELSTSLNRLSSGLRINSSQDDSSGLAIADKLRLDSNSAKQAIQNANSGMQ